MFNKILIDFDVINYAACYNTGDDYLMSLDKVHYYIEKIKNACECDDYTGYLTGKNNFRKTIATVAPYKGTRKIEKPKQFKNIREYLIDFLGGVVVDGKEADDQILEDYEEGCVVASNDKDFKTANVWIYNFIKDEMEYISEEQAIQNFLIQMLIGDKADNIPGLINPSKSHHKNPPNFTENTARQVLTGTISENFTKVTELYLNHYGDIKIFDEIATLLWIQRKNAKTYKECNLLYPQNV